MLREVCFLIGPEDTVLWSDASRSPTAMPDSRARWEAIWSRRTQIVCIAHTHPLGGLHFSATDEATMQALDTALGRAPDYAVVDPIGVLWRRTDPETGTATQRVLLHDEEPWWAELIRSASGLHASPHPNPHPEEE